jgi:hypothetical protein
MAIAVVVIKIVIVIAFSEAVVGTVVVLGEFTVIPAPEVSSSIVSEIAAMHVRSIVHAMHVRPISAHSVRPISAHGMRPVSAHCVGAHTSPAPAAAHTTKMSAAAPTSAAASPSVSH